MRRWMLLVVLTSYATAQAQGNGGWSKVEVFGGYAANKFFYTDSGESPTVANAAALFDFGWDRHHGLETSIGCNFTRYLGVKGEFSLFSSEPSGVTSQGLPIRIPQRAAYFMVGPEVKFRNRSRWTPFLYALAGGAHSWANLIVDLPDDPVTKVTQSHSRSGFSAALGGGMDFRMNHRISLRWTADYSATVLGNPDPEETGRQNNARTSMGLLFHLW